MTYIPQTQVGRTGTLSWTPTSGSLVPFASLVSISPPALVVGEVDSTLLASLFETYLPTLPAAEGAFKVQHWDNDPGVVAMQAAVRTAPVPLGTFLITFPSGATLSIPGFPKGYSVDEVQNKEVITGTVSFRQTGVHNYTPATG